MKSTTRNILFLLVMVFFAAGTATASAAEYHPVLFAYGLWSEGETTAGATLWGGYSQDSWKDLDEVPLKVQGQAVAAGDCPSFEEEDLSVETPLLRVGQKLDVVSVKDGSLKGTATVQSMGFICWEASGQWEISVIIKSDQEKPAPLADDLVVLLDAGEKINIPSTRREEGDQQVSFLTDAGSHGSAVEIRYVEDDQNEYDQAVFAGTLVRDGKESPFGQAYVESTDEIGGFFVDFKGDNRLEFVYSFDGPAGSQGIKSLSRPDSENDLISIDTGE